MNEIRTGRTLETVTAEIVTITAQTRYTMVSAAIEIGRRLAEARRQAALSDPEAAVFKMLFRQVQEDFQKMAEALGKVQDTALAEKLRGAARQLLERMGGQL